jgi:hypothetical protein
MRAAVATTLVFSALVVAHVHERDYDQHAMKASTASEEPIRITINPEARVSVSRGGACERRMVRTKSVRWKVDRRWWWSVNYVMRATSIPEATAMTRQARWWPRTAFTMGLGSQRTLYFQYHRTN